MSHNHLLFPDPPARIHFIGIKGVGMTAVAEILKAEGYEITGSDTNETFMTSSVLDDLGITVAENFSAEHIGSQTTAVIYSTAYGKDNVERQSAAEQGIPEWSYPEIVGFIMGLYSNSIAVAGSHGKTTTTALLARMLEEGGLDPTAIVGATVTDWRRNARSGRSQWFVLEADEYQNKFQYYSPRYLLITNIDYDHPDFFKTPEDYEQAFVDFASKLPSDGLLVYWSGDKTTANFIKNSSAKAIGYGEETNADWRLCDITISDSGTSFRVFRGENLYGDFIMPLIGNHYALDALGAMALAAEVGIDKEAITRALKYFRGTARRLEYIGEYKGALIFDDYAHHPREISATIRALQARYAKRKIWCVFQPHTFSRTEAFLSDFVSALGLAQKIILLPIYASAREQSGSVDSQDLARELVSKEASVAANLEEAACMLKKNIGENDLVVTMGAGDVWRVGKLLVA